MIPRLLIMKHRFLGQFKEEPDKILSKKDTLLYFGIFNKYFKVIIRYLEFKSFN